MENQVWSSDQVKEAATKLAELQVVTAEHIKGAGFFKHQQAVKQAREHILRGEKASGMSKQAFSWSGVKNWAAKNPHFAYPAAGALGGGLMGLSASAMSDDEDKQPWRSTLSGALSGGALGFGAHLFQRGWPSSGPQTNSSQPTGTPSTVSMFDPAQGSAPALPAAGLAAAMGGGPGSIAGAAAIGSTPQAVRRGLPGGGGELLWPDALDHLTEEELQKYIDNARAQADASQFSAPARIAYGLGGGAAGTAIGARRAAGISATPGWRGKVFGKSTLERGAFADDLKDSLFDGKTNKPLTELKQNLGAGQINARSAMHEVAALERAAEAIRTNKTPQFTAGLSDKVEDMLQDVLDARYAGTISAEEAARRLLNAKNTHTGLSNIQTRAIANRGRLGAVRKGFKGGLLGLLSGIALPYVLDQRKSVFDNPNYSPQK